MKSIRLLAIAAIAVLAAGCTDHSQDALNQTQSNQVKEIVKQALMENPAMVMDALKEHQRRAQQEAADNTKKSMQTNAAEIYNNPASPVMGNPNGNITVVEFFDYNCGYCKAVFHPIRDAVLQDGNIRFVFKEYPILGESSVLAAKAALAAGKQGKYVEFHTALMDSRAPKDEATITDMATKLGLDANRLKADMNSPDIQQLIQSDIALAQKLGVNGTPAFIVGDKFYPGALDPDAFKKLVEEFRTAKVAPAGDTPTPAPQPN